MDNIFGFEVERGGDNSLPWFKWPQGFGILFKLRACSLVDDAGDAAAGYQCRVRRDNNNIGFDI